MIYFTLPNFYLNFNLNKEFNKYIIENPTELKYPIKIQFMSGNFPFNIWNGGLNNVFDKGATYKDFLFYFNNNKDLPIRFNFSNILADDLDFTDAMTNSILEIFNTYNCFIEISNIPFMEYIQKKYSNYNFIFSKEADWIADFSPELINTILNYNKFTLISLPTRFNNNIKELELFNHPEKLELTINPLCPNNCQFKESCAIQEHKMQLEYSESSQYRECTKRYNIFNTQLITLDDIVKNYLPIGICHFNIDGWENNYTETNYLNFYVSYFIKKEFQMDAYLTIQKELTKYDKI